MKTGKILGKITKIMCVLGILFSLRAQKVKADNLTLEPGDKFYFADREWIVLNMTSTEWYLLSNEVEASYGTWNVAYNAYLNSAQDVALRAIGNGWSATDKSYVKVMQLQNEYYNSNGTYGTSGTAQARYTYGMSANEYCNYCYNRGWCNNAKTANVGGACGYLAGGETLTRTGHNTTRSNANRPMYYGNDGDLSGADCVKSADSVTYVLASAKNSQNVNVSNFTVDSSDPASGNPKITIAASTPAEVYNLRINATKTYNNGTISAIANTGGCYAASGSTYTYWWYRAATRLDPTKIPGIIYDAANARWYIGGNTMPTDASSESATKPYSTSQQTSNFTKARKTKTINYQLTIQKLPNPMTVTTPQSGAVLLGDGTVSNKAFTGASNAVGQVNYSLTAKDSGGNTVSYFSMPSSTSPQIQIASNTPAGTYTITIAAIAAGNTNYAVGNKTITYTMGVRKLEFNPSNLTFIYDASNAANSSPSSFGTVTGGSGATVTYSIVSQKLNGTSGSYFTLTGTNLKSVAGALPGEYEVVLRASDPGNSTYNANYREKTITATINKASQTITFNNQSGSVTYSSSAQTKAFSGITGAGDITYELLSQQDTSGAVNYFSINPNTNASINIAAETPAGTYTLSIKATASGNEVYNSASNTMTYTLTVNKADITAPIVQINENGIVTWMAVPGAGSYKISMENSNWTSASNATSGVDYNSQITQTTGARTVYVRAYGDSNHNSPDTTVGSATVNVYALTIKAGDDGIASVTQGGITGQTVTKNYIEGASVSINAELVPPHQFDKWEQQP